MSVKRPSGREVAPDQRPLTALQAQRLSALSGVTVKELKGGRVAELAEKFKWAIDPRLFRFRRVCGRVVKRDPVTGEEYGVPGATVYVEDTDCDLILYAPTGSKFTWFYPFRCKREVIATTTTDACGNFCVWIPRWDIDWILHWRKQRICFPVIFERPRWRDLLDMPPLEEAVPRPFPWPDPGPLMPRSLTALAQSREFGARATGVDALDLDAFTEDLHPPLPKEFTAIVGTPREKMKNGETHALVRASIANAVGLDEKLLQQLDLRHVIGPFRRCVDLLVPEWTRIVDVPDITFRVTQDVDGDGDEETIYGERYFQVRWNAGAIGNVTLHAASWARESRFCDAPPVIPCGNVPAINFAGMMPVTAPYHDNTTGYAIRPNRPRPGGVSTSPATAPYCLHVNLFGCLPKLPNAAKYRLVYRHAPNASSPFSAPLPFTNQQWYWHPLGGPPVPAVPAPVTGWYDLPPAGLDGTPEESFLFPFDTTQHVPGLYAVTVEIGNAGGTVLASSAEVRFMCDNRAPTILNQVRWSANGGATWTVLPTDCPVVRRGAVPADVLFEVTWTVMAPAHYRRSSVDSAGCGASGTAPVLDPAGQVTSDWHTGPNDNAMTYTLTYRLPSGNAEGTYSFGAYADSRAFNPSGYVAGYQTNDWLYDVGTSPIYRHSRVYFSVING
jgi:hypothetical protein